MTSLAFVDSITPATGSSGGGTAVTILGTRFTGTTAVTFGGNPAASFAVVDDNTITAVTPAGSGVVLVEITNADGSSSDLVLVDSSGNGFDGTYELLGLGSGDAKTYVGGLVAGNPALRSGNPDGTSRIQARVGPFTDFGEAPIGPDSSFSVAWWQSNSATLSGNNVDVWQYVQDFGGRAANLDMTLGPGGQIRFGDRGFVAETWLSDAVTVPADGAPHFFVLTFDFSGQTASIYMDATSIGWSQTGTVLNADFAEQFEIVGVLPEVIDEMATFRSVLSSGDVSTLYAAGLADFSSWESAVAALSPTAVYHFDDENSGLFAYRGQGWHVGRVGVGPI